VSADGRAQALRDALSEAETAESAAQEAQAAIRAAIAAEDVEGDGNLLEGIFLLVRELRLESLFAPKTPDEFLRRLERILRDAEVEIPAGVLR
jgi:hypothetical protein